MTNEVHTYRPHGWIRVAVGVTLIVFLAVTAIGLKTDLQRFYLAVLIAMVIASVIAMIETFVARVDVVPDTVIVKGLFRTERIALSGVQKVSAEGGRIGLLMKTGKWKKLPEWLGANMSARRRIADQLK